MINKRYVITKAITQIFLYFVEVVGIALLLTLIFNKFIPIRGQIDYVNRFLLFYGLYQLLVVIILTNLNDIKRDEYLALSALLKKCIICIDLKDEEYRNSILEVVNKQLDIDVFNDNEVRNVYVQIKENLDTDNRSFFELRLIDYEFLYELETLNWKYSFVLRMFK